MEPKAWHPADDRTLVRLYADETISMTTLARRMGRTYASVRNRITKLRGDGTIITGPRKPGRRGVHNEETT